MRGGIFNNRFVPNFPQIVPVKKNFEIGQFLAKIWTEVSWHRFMDHMVTVTVQS